MRLFVAVVPPTEVVEVIASIDRPALDGVRWTRPDQWHVTLRFLGEVDDPGQVVGAVEALAASGPVSVELGPATTRLGPSVLVVPAAGLEPLAAEVVEQTASLGEPPEDRPFRGHLTLARRRRGSRARLPTGVPVSAGFLAGELSIVRSHLDPAGARYESIAAVTL